MRAAIYLRISTDRQDEHHQEPECVRVCEARGWEPVFFREVASGAASRRPEWETLRDEVRRGNLGAVVVYSLSRMGRRRTQLASELADLVRWGCTLVSVKESFLDVDSSPELAPLRGVLIQWFAWFAEAERDAIVDRTNASIRHIKRRLEERGVYTARSSGRTLTRLGRPGHGEEWKRRARELAARGLSLSAIARELAAAGRIVGRSTVRDWIRAAPLESRAA